MICSWLNLRMWNHKYGGSTELDSQLENYMWIFHYAEGWRT